MPGYLMNGLCVGTDFSLDAYPSCSGRPDLRVATGGLRDVPGGDPDGEVLQRFHRGGHALYSTTRTPGGTYVVRAYHYLDFEVSEDLSQSTAWRHQRCPEGMIGVLASGLLLSVVLALKGEFALHASCVELEGQALAFSAPSGMGKSTLAAIACSLGAGLVTDDLLRLDMAGGVARCYLGSGENRLRRRAGDLSEAYAGQATATSADGRVLLQPGRSHAELAPLVGIVLPLPDRSAEQLELERVTGADCAVQLMGCFRALGWLSPSFQQAAFEAAAHLARQVPVYRARLPWGPPFDPAVVAELLRRAGLPGPGQPAPAWPLPLPR